MARDVITATEFTVTRALAFCGWCGNAKGEADEPCHLDKPYTSVGGVDWKRCPGSYPYAGDPDDGAQPTWCEYYVSADGGKSACSAPAEAVVQAGSASGVAVCEAHVQWAVFDGGAEARAEGKL